jgi:hypothetical protein
MIYKITLIPKYHYYYCYYYYYYSAISKHTTRSMINTNNITLKHPVAPIYHLMFIHSHTNAIFVVRINRLLDFVHRPVFKNSKN